MKITIVGAGYVGLVTSIGFAILGHEVNCIDVDKKKISMLKNGKSPIYEIGLEEKLLQFLNKGKLSFSSKFNNVSDIIFIAVGTPSLGNGSANLKFIFSAIDSLLKHPSNSRLLVIKSTVPTGTNRKIRQYLLDKGSKYKVASNPEFLKEGAALFDFLNPDRIVIGTNEKSSEKVLEQLYKPLISNGTLFISTDPATSELVKHSSNAFLATKIAFINELSDLSEKVGSNIDDLAKGIGTDHRIGKEFLKVGPGFGGSCFPKDIAALYDTFKKQKVKSFILESVITSNKQRFFKVYKQIESIIGNLDKKRIAFFGLSFKANTDDYRESPAIKILKYLSQHDVTISAYDPKVKKVNLDFDIEVHQNYKSALRNANALVIATEWEEFSQIDFNSIQKNNLMNDNIIIDLRNILDEEKIVRSGYSYYKLGKVKNVL